MADIHIGDNNFAVYRDNIVGALQKMYTVENVLAAGLGVRAFNPSWHTNTSLAQFCSDILNDAGASCGSIYLGQVSCSGLPENMISGTIKIEVSKGVSSKILLLTITSDEAVPYFWEQTYYVGKFSGWSINNPHANPSEITEAMYVRNGYLGVSTDYNSIIDNTHYHESIVKGTPITFVGVTGYIWAVFPSSYILSIAMNLVVIPMSIRTTTVINGVTYNIWRSEQMQSGSFKLYFF